MCHTRQYFTHIRVISCTLARIILFSRERRDNGILVPVKTSFSLRRRSGKRRMYQRKAVDVNILNAVKSLLADVSSVSPSSEQRVDYELGESLYSVRAH